jgi:hypothetical protein
MTWSDSDEMEEGSCEDSSKNATDTFSVGHVNVLWSGVTRKSRNEQTVQYPLGEVGSPDDNRPISCQGPRYDFLLLINCRQFAVDSYAQC